MPRYWATKSIVSVESQPISSWATTSAPITADCLRGYFLISLSISSNDLAERVIARLPVYFPENDIHRPDNGDRVGDHVALRHLVHRGEVRKARRADLQAIRLVRAVRDEIDAELALGRLDRGVALALGHVHALGEELEVVDQLFHVRLHLDPRRRRDLVVRGHDRTGIGAQPVDALPDDAVGLAHLLDAHEVTVVAVAVLADRDVEVDLVVHLVGLLLAQVPGDSRAAQHRPAEAQRERALRGHDADADGPLLPDAVLGEQRLVIVDALREALGEVLDEIEQRPLPVLVHVLQGLLVAGLLRHVLRHRLRQVAVDAAGAVVRRVHARPR